MFCQHACLMDRTILQHLMRTWLSNSGVTVPILHVVSDDVIVTYLYLFLSTSVVPFP